MISIRSAVLLLPFLLASVSHGRVARNERVGILANEVCYDGYGCFNTGSPWTSLSRPLSALPNPPYEVGTRFLLFTRNDPAYEKGGYELLPDRDLILEMSLFDVSKRTVFLIHGFTDSHKSNWMVNARDSLLANEDINLISVDWAPGAKSPYLSATANSRLVGRQVSRMIDYLGDKKGLQLSNVHIVGHSLGAHVAGYAGSNLGGGLARIVALDPMDPYFGGTDPMVRLDPSDAQHVQVIHTNGETGLNFGLGMQESAGHVDIYPNGGKSQPGCKDLLGNLVTSILKFITLNFEGAISTWACSHSRVVDFYVESLSSKCPFIAFPCKSYSDFKKGNCYSHCTDPKTCFAFGVESEKNVGKEATGDLYLNTGSSGQYCLQVAQPETEVSSSQQKTNGKVTVQLRSKDGTLSDKYTVADGTIKAGDVLSSWIEVPSKFNIIEERPSVILSYTRGGLLPPSQPKQLFLNNFKIILTDSDFNTKAIEYPAVTLDAGTDIQLP